MHAHCIGEYALPAQLFRNLIEIALSARFGFTDVHGYDPVCKCQERQGSGQRAAAGVSRRASRATGSPLDLPTADQSGELECTVPLSSDMAARSA